MPPVLDGSGSDSEKFAGLSLGNAEKPCLIHKGKDFGIFFLCYQLPPS
jgi:hypothetical protein